MTSKVGCGQGAERILVFISIFIFILSFKMSVFGWMLYKACNVLISTVLNVYNSKTYTYDAHIYQIYICTYLGFFYCYGGECMIDQREF